MEVGTTTRDRILAAAIARFARYSYEDTGLRDIAADTGVDVAYVHRCFGSKAQLFAEAVQATISRHAIPSGTANDLATYFTRLLFQRDDAKFDNKVNTLDIMLRSLSSSEAMPVLRKSVLDNFVQPLAGRLPDPGESRAALIAAFLMGFGIFKHILLIESLREPAGDKVEMLAREIISHLLEADTDLAPASEKALNK